MSKIYNCRLSLEAFTERLKEIVDTDTLVVMSRGAAARYGLSEFLAGRQWVCDILSNPTVRSVGEAVSHLTPFSKIMAVGGGSVIDTAKAIMAIYGCASDTARVIESKSYLNNAFRVTAFTAVPTTAGTGSEVTRWATVWDSERRLKLSLEADWLEPTEVWLVPELTLSLPPRQTLSCGLDALCQACEAYWARKSDPLAKALAVQAVMIIRENLPPALENGGNSAAREELLTGALIAGMAFSRTGTTACHSISYPLTALFGVEHGFAAALTLAPIAERNAATVDCRRLFGALGEPGDIRVWLDSICANIQELRLSAFGIGSSDIPLIAQRSFTAGRMDNNPVCFTETDVELILSEVL
jgi:alcohol dehydrogenase class IV